MAFFKTNTKWQASTQDPLLTNGEGYIAALTSVFPVDIFISTIDINRVTGYITIKDAQGNASNNNITITGEGGQLIDGQSQYIINTDFGGVTLQISAGTLTVVAQPNPVWDESSRKTINLGNVVNTDIVTNTRDGDGSLNLVFNNSPQNQQVAIDVSNYIGAVDSLTVDYRLKTTTVFGGERTAWGRQTITPSAQAIQYFSEDPTNNPTPLTPLGDFYKFVPSNVEIGNYWELWARIANAGVDGLDVEFKLEILQQNSGALFTPDISILYHFKRYI